jgi:bifunctional UDP-N-acetylglucosamine pyrophosphorylase/glucosamine-1-phosphate N-acetyltransferase
VEIGAGATVGAGSTITKNVEDNQLALGRSRQKVVPGWKKPAKKEAE